MTISSEAWHQIPLRGTLVSNTLIDASHVDEPIDYVVADIFGNNDTTLTAAVIIEATCIRFPTRVSDIAFTRRPRPRAVQEWTSRRAAPVPSHGGEKR
jgi:hypothetical protein